MNKFLVLLIIGLTILAGWKILGNSRDITSPSTANEPKSVNLTPEKQDLGTVIYGDIAKTQFTLTNFTPNPLKITRVSTSCGCTSAEVEKDELQPYEETVLNVSFDPAVHKDDTDLGDVTRTIYIDTDNPNFAKLTVDITAQVIETNK